MDTTKLSFGTLAVHAGQEPDPATGSRAVPIYQTTSYVFNDVDHAANLFALKEFGNIYTRIMNPTTDVLEKRMAALDGGVAALAVASGSAAIIYAILNIASSGDEIVSISTLYGGTYNLFSTTLPRFGVQVKFADPDDLASVEAQINEKTRALYIETIGNPQINVVDIRAMADHAHKHQIPLIVDNTFATPYLTKPIEHGADIVVYSATKFIGGHGTSIGGVIVDGGTFDWKGSGKFPSLVDPDPSYHGVSYVENFGPAAYILKARVQLLRDTGACLSPFNAFLLLQGLETLHLRMDRHVHNAKVIAEYLEQHANVTWVSFPSLKSSKYHELSQKYCPKGSGAVLAFGLQGGYAACKQFINSLELFSLLANVADAKSLVIHPASTTHQQLSPEQRQKAGVREDLIRLSIGIEDSADLIADLTQAIASAHA